MLCEYPNRKIKNLFKVFAKFSVPHQANSHKCFHSHWSAPPAIFYFYILDICAFSSRDLSTGSMRYYLLSWWSPCQIKQSQRHKSWPGLSCNRQHSEYDPDQSTFKTLRLSGRWDKKTNTVGAFGMFTNESEQPGILSVNAREHVASCHTRLENTTKIQHARLLVGMLCGVQTEHRSSSVACCTTRLFVVSHVNNCARRWKFVIPNQIVWSSAWIHVVWSRHHRSTYASLLHSVTV